MVPNESLTGKRTTRVAVTPKTIRKLKENEIMKMS
jgi:hypothetical protein